MSLRRSTKPLQLWDCGVLAENPSRVADMARKRLGHVDLNPELTSKLAFMDSAGDKARWVGTNTIETWNQSGVRRGGPESFDKDTDLYQMRNLWGNHQNHPTHMYDMLHPYWQTGMNMMGGCNDTLGALINQTISLPFANDNLQQISSAALFESKFAGTNPLTNTYAKKFTSDYLNSAELPASDIAADKSLKYKKDAAIEKTDADIRAAHVARIASLPPLSRASAPSVPSSRVSTSVRSTPATTVPSTVGSTVPSTGTTTPSSGGSTPPNMITVVINGREITMPAPVSRTSTVPSSVPSTEVDSGVVSDLPTPEDYGSDVEDLGVFGEPSEETHDGTGVSNTSTVLNNQAPAQQVVSGTHGDYHQPVVPNPSLNEITGITSRPGPRLVAGFTFADRGNVGEPINERDGSTAHPTVTRRRVHVKLLHDGSVNPNQNYKAKPAQAIKASSSSARIDTGAGIGGKRGRPNYIISEAEVRDVIGSKAARKERKVSFKGSRKSFAAGYAKPTISSNAKKRWYADT